MDRVKTLLNSTLFWGVFIGVTVTVMLWFSIDTPAHSKPIISHHFPDVCKNIKGKQTIYAVLESNRFHFVGDPDDHICVRVRNPHH